MCPTCRCSLNNTLHSADDDGTRDEGEADGNGGDGQRDGRNARSVLHYENIVLFSL